MFAAGTDEGVGPRGVAVLVAVGIMAYVRFVDDVALHIVVVGGALVVGRDADLAGNVALDQSVQAVVVEVLFQALNVILTRGFLDLSFGAMRFAY